MSLSTLLFEVDESGIALITVNRPDKMNALNATVLNELDDCFAEANETDTIHGVIITGSGPKAFVAGADIQEFATLDPGDAEDMASRGQAVFQRIENMLVPVIAAVNGFALGGGCELALACHIRIASDNARFGQPEVNLGLIPGYGGTQRLPRLVGRGIATELLLSGEMISADRAYEIGLVNHVLPADDLLSFTKKMMDTIISKAPVATSLALEAIRASSLSPAKGMARESVLFGRAVDTEDFKEGVTAFLEKRPAKFSGR